MDISELVLDEIALEGLDGITPSALWIRLKNRMETEEGSAVTVDVSETTYEYFWEICRESSAIFAYVLPEPRPCLVIYDRFSHTDEESDLPCEPTEVIEDIYPVKIVDDKIKGFRGSCKEYETREEVTQEFRGLTYAEAISRWGERLVLVASQSLRNTALLGPNWNPNQELHINSYVLLERIGRGRYLGETTVGKMGLTALNLPAKTSHYHRKPLLKYKLISKQGFYHKVVNGRVNFGLLLHLSRFYVEYIPSVMVDCMYVIEMLREAPNNIMPLDDIRSNMQSNRPLRKILKNPSLRKFVSVTERIPFRTLYPDATKEQYQPKGARANPERMVACIRLLDPNTTEQDLLKPPDEEAEVDDEEDDDEDGFPGLLDTSRIVQRPKVSIARHSYEIILEAGPSGIPQKDFGKRIGLSKLDTRTVLRHLIKLKAVYIASEQRKRQKLTKYIATVFQDRPSGEPFRIQPATTFTRLAAHSSKKKKKDNPEPPSTQERAVVNVAVEEPAEAPPPTPSRPERLAQFRKVKMEARSGEQEGASVEQEECEEGETGEETVMMETEAGGSVEGEAKPADFAITETTHDGYEKFRQIALRHREQELRTGNRSQMPLTDVKAVRLDKILEMINQEVVVEGAHKLRQMILDQEKKAGSAHGNMCKRSLWSILSTLEARGDANVYFFRVSANGKEKMHSFVCKAKVGKDHPLIKNTLEQSTLKVGLLTKEHIQKVRSKHKTLPSDIEASVLERESGLISTPDLAVLLKGPRDIKVAKRNGYEPKFIRMKELHFFMHYLLYTYDGSDELDQKAAVESIEAEGYEFDDELKSMMPKLYQSRICLEMFTPPLPEHSGWGRGWLLVSDLLLRMPLALFVKLVNVNYEVPRLKEFLADRVKRLLPVRVLPKEILQYLLFARKYIFSVHRVLEQLAYAGLLQFSPSVMKEKDQIFVYVNKVGSVKDTTISPPGFVHIDASVTYTTHQFVFVTREDVAKYWDALYTTCVGTQLGCYEGLVGQVYEVPMMEKKPELQLALQPRKSEETYLYDNGTIPGDNLGAGGLDSSFFGHLKRNWSNLADLANTKAEPRPTSKRVKIVEKPVPENKNEEPSAEPVQKKRRKRVKTDNGEPSDAPPKKSRTQKKPSAEAQASDGLEAEGSAPGEKQGPAGRMKRFRTVRCPARSARKEPYYDEKDKESLGHMRSLRVDWSEKEDELLLLARAVSAYLYPNSRNSAVSGFLIRDVLHMLLPTASKNKTSRACSRRMVYMLKKMPHVAAEANLLAEEISCDSSITQKYPTISDIDVQEVGRDKRNEVLGKRFIGLMKALFEILDGRPVGMLSMMIGRSFQLPSCLAEFHRKYELFSPTTKVIQEHNYPEIATEDAVTLAVLQQVIFSSFWNTDKTSRVRQLVEVYKSYSDALLRKAFADIRATGVLAAKKKYRQTASSGNQLTEYNMCNAPFRLSVRLIHLLMGKYKTEYFGAIEKDILRVPTIRAIVDGDLSKADDADLAIGQGEIGLLTLVSCASTIFDLKIRVEIPEQVMVINPEEIPKTDNVDEVLDRFRSILRNIGMSEEAASAFLEDEQRLFQSKKKDRRTKEAKEEEKRRKKEEKAKEEMRKETVELVPLLRTDTVSIHREQSSEESLGNRLSAVAAKRIFLYSTRRFASEKVEPQKNNFDVFVIKACALKVAVQPVEENRPEVCLAVENGTLKSFPKAEMVATKKKRIELQNKLVDKSRIPMSKMGMPGVTDDSLEDLGFVPDELDFVKKILKFIEEKQAIGATKREILDAFGEASTREKLSEIVKRFVNAKLVFRLGSVAVRYVAKKSALKWSIRTFQLTRLEREKLGSMAPDKANQTANYMEFQGKKRKHSEKSEPPSVDQPEAAKIEEPSINESGDTEPTANSKLNYINAIIRPWIRIDGSLNKPALSQLLLSVLSYVMERPGVTMFEIAKRFLPSLVNRVTYELVEILDEMKCVVRFVVRKEAVTLFSPCVETVIDPCRELDDESEICVEATSDALIKLPLFSQGSYAQQEQYKCPCHPHLYA